MEEFALIKSRVNLDRVDKGIALISDIKVYYLTNVVTEITTKLKKYIAKTNLNVFRTNRQFHGLRRYI